MDDDLTLKMSWRSPLQGPSRQARGRLEFCGTGSWKVRPLEGKSQILEAQPLRRVGLVIICLAGLEKFPAEIMIDE